MAGSEQEFEALTGTEDVIKFAYPKPIEAADLAVEISDDGSLDTVIVVNGSEYRFTYDPEAWVDSGEDREISDEVETEAYDAFVEWAEAEAD